MSEEVGNGVNVSQNFLTCEEQRGVTHKGVVNYYVLLMQNKNCKKVTVVFHKFCTHENFLLHVYDGLKPHIIYLA